MKVIGLMSGTSLDGCDVALVEIEKDNYTWYNLGFCHVAGTKEDTIVYEKEDDKDKIIKELNQKDPIYNELVKVINKYLIYDDINLIIHKIKTSTIPETSYNGAINIIDYLDHISDDTEYIFFLGFNDGQVPISYKDTEYITDSIKKYLNLEDTRVLNKYLRIDIIKNLSDIKNLTITYKEKDDKKTYYKSTLSDYFKEVPANINKEISYSKKLNQIKLASCYDEYIKYGYKSKDFAYLLNNYSINYFSYNNKYTHIKRDLDKLKLSYSKMQNYNKCAFKYYLTDILKLDIYEENFSTVIGSMVHFVLEQCLSNNETDIDKYVAIFIGDKTFTKKEKTYNASFKIIIEAEDAEVKKVEKNIHKYSYHHLVDNKVVEWLIYMIGYAIVLITVSKLFQSFTINTSHFGIYAFLAAIIIYILNQTVKPLINYITIPLTIITWGMLYPLSNVIILYITSLILGKSNFSLNGIIPTFFIAIFISFLNILMEGFVIKPITNRKNK